MTALLPLCIVLAYALAWVVMRRVGDFAQWWGRIERKAQSWI